MTNYQDISIYCYALKEFKCGLGRDYFVLFKFDGRAMQKFIKFQKRREYIDIYNY